MNFFPKNCLYLIKFKNQKKRIWLKSSGARKSLKVINYWRERSDFQYCKVYKRNDDKTLGSQLYWFNTKTEGYPDDDRKTTPSIRR